ncbi:helix-turn-helix transcriptional regulator [Stutzerimonas azotifigens]|uniref:helix-turn-helix transcriptional regulator n=1 Tax=Stutzerimonas azotifigens TaxID=291995 RepID=UPI000415C41D|nr:helix-turn-helix transcriptional regulator [Stutzerimonas azotifigens]MBZ5755692.1 helix-turn-helix transcriptional regulator [Pseudomonas sp. S5(2021)]
MSVQIITRNGEPEYAVLPWDEYQALLREAGRLKADSTIADTSEPLPSLAEIAGLREKQGLGQQELARAVGISPAYLAMIEAGERQPDDAIRRALARVLQVPGWEALP